MNQILSTSMPENNKKDKNKKSILTENIIKFFGVSLLMFSVLIIGIGLYKILNNRTIKPEENLEPTISIENKSETEILLKVTHQKSIAKVEYTWNDGEPVVINGNNGQYLEKQITIPSGTSTLHILVQDEDGKEITYDKQYELQSNIYFEVSGNKIKITYEGDKIISYMTYRWDDLDEKRIDINDTVIEEEIEAVKGLHTLTVVVVDINNNTDTKEQKINGVSKPKVDVGVDDQKEHFVIIATDEQKIEKIRIRLNQDEDQDYVLNLKDFDYKEVQYVLPIALKTGENTIEVTVYNSNGVNETTGVLTYVK